MTTASQCKRIADHLRAGKRITSLDALRMFGVARCAARVENLRKEGMEIKTEMVQVIGVNGIARVAEYSLKREGA